MKWWVQDVIMWHVVPTWSLTKYWKVYFTLLNLNWSWSFAFSLFLCGTMRQGKLKVIFFQTWVGIIHTISDAIVCLHSFCQTLVNSTPFLLISCSHEIFVNIHSSALLGNIVCRFVCSGSLQQSSQLQCWQGVEEWCVGRCLVIQQIPLKHTNSITQYHA